MLKGDADETYEHLPAQAVPIKLECKWFSESSIVAESFSAWVEKLSKDFGKTFLEDRKLINLWETEDIDDVELDEAELKLKRMLAHLELDENNSKPVYDSCLLSLAFIMRAKNETELANFYIEKVRAGGPSK